MMRASVIRTGRQDTCTHWVEVAFADGARALGLVPSSDVPSVGDTVDASHGLTMCGLDRAVRAGRLSRERERMKVTRHGPLEHGGQNRCHRCDTRIAYNRILIVVTDDVKATRYYHDDCWDALALSASPSPSADGDTARIAGELREVADDLAASVAQWKPGDYCVEIVNGANYAVRRLNALADQLTRRTDGDGGTS